MLNCICFLTYFLGLTPKNYAYDQNKIKMCGIDKNTEIVNDTETGNNYADSSSSNLVYNILHNNAYRPYDTNSSTSKDLYVIKLQVILIKCIIDYIERVKVRNMKRNNKISAQHYIMANEINQPKCRDCLKLRDETKSLM